MNLVGRVAKIFTRLYSEIVSGRCGAARALMVQGQGSPPNPET